MSKKCKTVAIIGGGAMGSALVAGILRAQLVEPTNLIVSDIRKEALQILQKRFGVKVTENNVEATRFGEVVICAVKPSQVEGVLKEISSALHSGHLLISVAAGISLDFLEKHLPSGIPVIRAMPNLPALIGEGVTALALGSCAGKNEQEKAETLFGAVGKVVTLPEENLDAVTGLSGSGPAYVFLVIEALADGGVKMGLTRQVALELAVQTVIGAAKMVEETGEHPAVLKDRVASPGGSTIAALHVLEENKTRGIFISAVEAATQRSRELKNIKKEEGETKWRK